MKEVPRLRIHEIFYSIQGESSYGGLPFVFVRLSGCHIRCRYCDTKEAWEGGKEMTVKEVMKKVTSYPAKRACITGGEPLLQEGVYPLMEELLGQGFLVLLETSGTIPVRRVQERVIKVMDIKCPGSGEEEKNLPENLDLLSGKDEVKFVLTGRKDYLYAKRFAQEKRLFEKWEVLFSPAYGFLDPKHLARWMLHDGLPGRLQIQLHKVIFGAGAKGV